MKHEIGGICTPRVKGSDETMKIIGLCGGSGSGKSSLAACMAALGAEIIDADQIARSLTAPASPLLPELRNTFGDNIFFPDGSLNRKALASVVFPDPVQLKRLNALMHPAICKQIQDRLNACRARVAVIDAAVLHQAGLEKLCHMTVFVTAPKEVRLQRIMNRDGISRQAAQARIDAQPTEEEYRQAADLTICNDGACSQQALAELILRS